MSEVSGFWSSRWFPALTWVQPLRMSPSGDRNLSPPSPQGWFWRREGGMQVELGGEKMTGESQGPPGRLPDHHLGPSWKPGLLQEGPNPAPRPGGQAQLTQPVRCQCPRVHYNLPKHEEHLRFTGEVEPEFTSQGLHLTSHLLAQHLSSAALDRTCCLPTVLGALRAFWEPWRLLLLELLGSFHLYCAEVLETTWF